MAVENLNPVAHAEPKSLPVSPEDVKVYVERMADGQWYVYPIDLPPEYDECKTRGPHREDAINVCKELCAKKANFEIAKFHRDHMRGVGEVC